MPLPSAVEDAILAALMQGPDAVSVLRSLTILRRERAALRRQIALRPDNTAAKRGLEENAAKLAVAEDALALVLGL